MLEAWGRAYTWKKLDFWGNRWGFAGPDGAVIVSFAYSGRLEHMFKLEGTADISPGTPEDRNNPLLLTLGWYVMVMMSDDNTAVIAATAAI
jgi:hypothetical protein